MLYISGSYWKTRYIGRIIGKHLRAGDVVLFKGGLGVGKTTLTKGLTDVFNATEPVTSPTFSIVNEYPARVPIYHFDLYRISSYEELEAIGFFDYLKRGGIVVVEWSENVPELEQELDNLTIIEIEQIDEQGRAIKVWGKYYRSNNFKVVHNPKEYVAWLESGSKSTWKPLYRKKG